MPKISNFKQPPELPKLEEEILKWWQENKIFEKSVEQRDKSNAYVFYDGPPFATGLPHYGHLLGSTTKDVIPRYQTMKGKRVERVWGWDCHGLPIENIIEQKLEIKDGKKGIEKLGIDNFNQACRTEVLRLDKEWEKIIDRLGRWVDFENNYKTMDCSYMESVWWGFGQLYKKGLVYEGKKVILYCPRCETALSNFEIAMDNSYKDITEVSNVYQFPVKNQENTYLLAWSTTPWNKLATPALAVNPKLTYIKIEQDNKKYILAETTLGILLDKPYKILEKYTGKDLEKLEFEMLYDFYPNRSKDEKAGVIIADEFVTADEGTGIVTLAVYGEDDFRVMKEHGVQLVEHVDSEGKLKPEVKPWAGMNILKVNSLVNEDLVKRELMYREDKLNHSVATCYRCNTRLYYAPLPAWFINVQEIKDELIKQNEKINWFPKHLKHGRFLKGLQNAPDWNISRSRYWGTPMPIWKSVDGQMRIISSIEELKTWAVNPEEVNSQDIHRENLDNLEIYVDDEKKVKGKRISEVFDCWVESGSMPFASRHYPFENKQEFESTYPAQFVSEYIAQTRAWFYTMHVMSVSIFDQIPFENVLTTGTLMAEDGTKLSKSKKNFVDPMILINQYGVDSLRLYLMSSTVMKSENQNFSEKEVADIRRKVFVIWWNVLSFYKTFANHDYFDLTEIKKIEAQHVLDKWLLSRVNTLIADVTKYLDSYDVIRASRALMSFVNELSTWYLRLSRDRLRAKDNYEVSKVFGYAIYTLAQLFAPICPFFSELVHQNMVDEGSSVHLTDWPVEREKVEGRRSKVEEEMQLVQKIVELGHAKRKEKAIGVRQPLAEVKVSGAKVSQELEELIKQELNVKKVSWLGAGSSELEVDYDLELTPELKSEGEARDLIRKINNLRRKQKLLPTDQVKVTLPSWPEKWQEEIERKTGSKLVEGDELLLST